MFADCVFTIFLDDFVWQNASLQKQVVVGVRACLGDFHSGLASHC